MKSTDGAGLVGPLCVFSFCLLCVVVVVVEFVCPSPCLELANSGRAKQLDCNLQTAETKNKRTRQIEAAIDRLIQESFLHVLLILGIGRPMDQ